MFQITLNNTKSIRIHLTCISLFVVSSGVPTVKGTLLFNGVDVKLLALATFTAVKLAVVTWGAAGLSSPDVTADPFNSLLNQVNIIVNTISYIDSGGN